MRLDHLIWPKNGWGYMPAQEDVFAPFRYVQEHYKPKSIFEIGFCWGHSTTYQLEIMPQAKMVTLGPISEPNMRKERPDPALRLEQIKKMYEIYGDREKGGRFQHLQGKTHYLQNQILQEFTGRFDFALIDGYHYELQVETDVCLCEDLRIRTVLVDNWTSRQVGNTVLKRSDYKLVKEFPYTQVWKGKTEHNVLALCTL